jgi:hypothetical protein
MRRSSLIMGAALPLVLCALAGCGGGGGGGGGNAARDSAGVRIVENARPGEGDGATWTVGAEPTVGSSRGST